MCSLASAAQKSSSLASTVDISPSLTMSENFQNPASLGASNPLQLSAPLMSNAAFLTGSVCNFSRVSAPAVSSAWLLPSDSATSFQTLMGTAHLYQHSSTTRLSGVTGQRQASTSAASNSGMFEWAMTGGAQRKSSSLRDFTMTVADQNTDVSSMPMASQYNTSDANNMAPMYPSLSASLVQGAPYHIPNQGYSLSLPYQEGSQVYYYQQGTMAPLLSGELGPYLQSYGSVTYTASRASAPQPEMVMVLKQVQPTNAIPSASTSRIYYPVSTQPIPETGFQVTETSLGMETSRGLQPVNQTLCQPPTAQLPKACSRNFQTLGSNPPPELGDVSMAPLVQSSRNLLALPPAQIEEQKGNKNLDDIQTQLSKPLDGYQMLKENQDPSLLHLEIPDIHQLLDYTDLPGQKEQPGCEDIGPEKNSLSLKDQGTLENGTDSNDDLVDIAMLVEDIQLPQLLSSLDDLDQDKGAKGSETKDTRGMEQKEVQRKSGVIKAPSDHARKNKHKASEPMSGAPRAKIKPESPDCVFVGEMAICNAGASDRAPVNTAKHFISRSQKGASSRTSKTKSHGQEKTKRTKENNSKKDQESKQSGNKVKPAEKPTIPKGKRKRHQPELTQETFKKPRSSLGMHMLASVQVFHALGKKSDKKTEPPSFQALGNSSHPKGPQPVPDIKRRLESPHDGNGPDKTPVKRRKPHGGAKEEGSSPSQYELPPPGKVKLIPLVFPTLEKPAARPVPRRPQSLASGRPAVANPTCPASNSAQPTAANSLRPTPATLSASARPAQEISTKPAPPGFTDPARPPPSSAQPTAFNSSQPTLPPLAGPARPAWPNLTNPSEPSLTNPARPSFSHSAASRPVPYKTSTDSFQRETIHTSLTKTWIPPKSQNQYLLQDFALQPIPWRKPNVPEPVMSMPITAEQRPEREAMKRQAQLERENAAKYTSLGKVQYFIEREKEMEISLHYGYAG